MKKILFMINTLQGGGAEKVLLDLLHLLDKEKYDVSLITVEKGIYSERLPKNITFRSIITSKNKLIKTILKKIVYHLPKPLFNFLFLRGKYDLEIAYLEGFPTRVVAARKNSAKRIAFVHCDVSMNSVLDLFYKSKDEILKEYNSFDKVCFVSNGAQIGFEKSVGKIDNACVLHNVIDVDEIIKKSNDIEEPLQTDVVKIVAAGRLTDVKRFDRLIKAAAQLQEKYEFKIYILGEGEQCEYLKKLIKDLGVTTVELLGFKSNPYSYIKQADFFVCSSSFEGYSMVVRESIVLGVPVLATDCVAMSELLEKGKYGKIVPNEDQALIDGLEMFLANPDIVIDYRKNIKNKKELIGKEKEDYENLFDELCKN